MGDHNNDPVQDQDGSQDQTQEQGQSQGRKGGLLLDYSLTPLANAAVFTLHRQHPSVTRFLETVGTFMASNGIRISLGVVFPEWKESLNTIYLDGTNGRALNRPDITRFAPVLKYHKDDQTLVSKGRRARNNKMQMFHDAIAELCQTVSDTYSFTQYESAGRVDVGRVRISG